MIRLTRLNGKEIFVNAELIKFIETTPDTILSLTDDDKLNVLESPEEVIAAIIEYRRKAYGALPTVVNRQDE